jgi:Holliday junction resolvasome RuvABC endonuclease subunit
MNILAISKSTDNISFALFKEKVLVTAQIKLFKEFESHKRKGEIYQMLTDLIIQHQVGIVATNKVAVEDYKKKDVRKIFEMRAIIELVCNQNKVVYIEQWTNGWERYITNGRNTARKKIEIVNKGYGLDLKFDNNLLIGQQDLADAIILGEAIAHRRLFV